MSTKASSLRRYVVEPQRRIDGAFQPCEPHAAQRFAVLGIKNCGKTRKGKPIITTQVHSNWPSAKEAQATADTLNGALRKPRRTLPALGQRFPHDGVTTIIARGVGRNLGRKL